MLFRRSLTVISDVFFDAAFICVRQVNEELFAGGSIKDMDERGDINRMEELVMRRLEWE